MRVLSRHLWLVPLVVTAFLLPARGQDAARAKPDSIPPGNASQNPTPRTSDGHPDLNGMWTGSGPTAPAGARGGPKITPPAPSDGAQETVRGARDGSVINLEEDGYLINHSDGNPPWYKPEYWDKVRHLDAIGYRTPLDPGYSCNENPGLTRLGLPLEIIQFPKKIIILYQTPGDGGNVANITREIPTDGRSLPSEDDYEGTRVMGSSVGHWDGDTLVIQTVDIAADASWLGTPGWFHSGQMKVTERIRRDGDILSVDMTVEDPGALLRPWVLPTEHDTLNTNPHALYTEPVACMENDGDHLVGTQ